MALCTLATVHRKTPSYSPAWLLAAEAHVSSGVAASAMGAIHSARFHMDAALDMLQRVISSSVVPMLTALQRYALVFLHPTLAAQSPPFHAFCYFCIGSLSSCFAFMCFAVGDDEDHLKCSMRLL